MDLHQAGMDAVDRFIDTWNSRNAEQWASSLHFPHVRPSPHGTTRVIPTAEDYVAGVDYSKVIATGWDHSEWDYRQVIHTSHSRIHVAGQWSRYNAAGEVIHTNPITYIVTHHDGRWGIQSRFAADFAGDDADTSGLETRAFRLIQDFVVQYNQNNQAACAELVNYPHIAVEVGHVVVREAPADFVVTGHRLRIDSLLALQVGNHSLNVAADLNVSTDDAERDLQAVINLTLKDGHLGIHAWSFLDPSEPAPEAGSATA